MAFDDSDEKLHLQLRSWADALEEKVSGHIDTPYVRHRPQSRASLLRVAAAVVVLIGTAGFLASQVHETGGRSRSGRAAGSDAGPVASSTTQPDAGLEKAIATYGQTVIAYAEQARSSGPVTIDRVIDNPHEDSLVYDFRLSDSSGRFEAVVLDDGEHVGLRVLGGDSSDLDVSYGFAWQSGELVPE
jgi:hypothetical protein